MFSEPRAAENMERLANNLLKLNYKICLDAHPAPAGSSGRVLIAGPIDLPASCFLRPGLQRIDQLLRQRPLSFPFSPGVWRMDQERLTDSDVYLPLHFLQCVLPFYRRLPLRDISESSYKGPPN